MEERVEVKRSGYTVLKNWVIDRDDLTSGEKLAYMALCRHANSDKECFPSYATIAKKMSASRKTAKRAILSLVEKGLVQYEERRDPHGDQTSHLYTITDEIGVGSQLPHPRVTATPRVGSQLPPKDSQLKDSQLRKGNPPPQEQNASKDATAITYDDIAEWLEDFADVSLQTDAASLANFNRLDEPTDVKREALIEWRRADKKPGVKKLAWFMQQGGPFLATARAKYDETAKVKEEIRRGQEEFEQFKLEQERLQARPEEVKRAEQEEMDAFFANLKEKLGQTA